MRYVLCCTRTHARARTHTHTHRHTHESGHTFVHVHLLDNYACKQHTENSNAHRHTLKQVHAHTHTHTHAAENMVFDKLSYELETLQSSHAPKYEIDRVGKMRANCRCVPHTFLRCERSWSHAHALTRSSIESCELLSLFVLLHLFLT
jgi:hypothetical protein